MGDDGTPAGAGPFRRPSVTDPAAGGKARSLARLDALGLPVPRAFVVVSTAEAPVLHVDGPAPPGQLRTADDLAALDEARAAVVRAPFTAAFQMALPGILAALAPPGDVAATFSVRSSSALEDSARAAAPGVFESSLRVPRAGVSEAVRTVLASALSPAAWAYVLRAGQAAHGPIAVLVHRFVEGDAQGAVVCANAGDEARIDVHAGALAVGARAVIEEGARRAAQAGPVELEWTAARDDITFLQLRPFQRGRAAQDTAPAPETRAALRDGWSWDAAHNPAPLSPAQAGLVAWVDARCALGFRQRVVDGYLFFRNGDAPLPAGAPRALFDRLQADVTAAIGTLGPAPRLREALHVYTTGYQGLFGVVQPAGAAARTAFRDFLRAHAPAALPAWSSLVDAEVPSAATRRRAAAGAIAAATAPAARHAAIAAYLAVFGDESARWDVAEPTLREAPERLLFLGRTTAGPPGGAAAVSRGAGGAETPAAVAARLGAAWPEAHRARFQAYLAAAREASAVAEDDDALFARLQAVVRAALLTLGQRQVTAGRLSRVEDVFFLPLDLSLLLDDGAAPEGDLNALAAAGRASFTSAAARSPALSPPAGAPVVTGQGGAGGRVIGRVVLDPLAAALPAGTPAVLVAATLLPTELPLLDAAALVVETGTPLGHVAAQARERGIPAVVAATGACAALRAGQWVLVDGDRGVVVPLDEP